jgi:hypothetical protein
VQPLIVDYEKYRPTGFDWINIWSKMDIVSGELNYYDAHDDPTKISNKWPCVQNMVDLQADVPLYAHLQYWNNDILRRQLYNLVTTDRGTIGANPAANPAP